MNQDNFKQLEFTILGKQTNLEGKFEFSGDTIINGRIKGEVNVLNQSKVTLERESEFEGTIYAHDIDIFGKAQGQIICTGIATIRPSANVSGLVKAISLNIYPGATLNVEGHTQEI